MKPNENTPTEETNPTNQEAGRGCNEATCSSSSTIYEKITVIGGIIFVICIPASCFFLHPALGLLATGTMGFLCAKCAIEVHRKGKDDSETNV